MGLFGSRSKQRALKEQESWQNRQSSFAVPRNTEGGRQEGNFLGTGHIDRPHIVPHDHNSTGPTAYQIRSNIEPTSPYGNYDDQAQYRNGVSNSSNVYDGIETETLASTDLCSNPFGSALWSWIPHVTQPADDATVIERVKDVFASTEQFVNNFYADQSYEHEVPDRSLRKVNCSSLYPDHQLRQYLSKADCHISLIKHTLLCLLLDLISFDSASSKGSLLPLEFQYYSIIAKARTASTATTTEIPNLQPVLSSFRVLSAYVRSDIQKDSNYLQQQQNIIDGVVRNFESAFRFWVNEEQTQEDRQAALRRLLQKSGILGIFLFSQPAVFLFSWEMTQQDQADHLVPIWPRLLKVYDEEAQLRDVSDHLIPMKYGVIFRKTSGQHTLVQTADDATTGPTQSSRSDSHNHTRTEGRKNGSMVSKPNRTSNTSKRRTQQGAADQYRESISPLNSDDEGSDRSWISNDAQNTPHQISSSTRLHQEPTMNPAGQHSQPSITSIPVIHPHALTPGVRGISEPFTTNRTGNGTHTPDLNSRSLSQQPQIASQPSRTHPDNFGVTNSTQNWEAPSDVVHNISNESQSRPQNQQSRPVQYQHSRTASNPIHNGAQPPRYSSLVPNQNYGSPSNRNVSPSHFYGLNRSAATTSNPPERATEPSLSTTNQFSRAGQEQLYFDPPPNTQKQRSNSSSSLPRFLQRRSSSSRDKSRGNPDPMQQQQQQQQQQQNPSRERGRNRAQERYPPNAFPRFGAGNATQTTSDQRDVDYGSSERLGRSNERSEGERGNNGSRSRKRSSSVASSVKRFFMGDGD